MTREAKREYMRRWTEKNGEAYNALRRSRYAADREKRTADRRARYAASPEAHRKESRQWAAANPVANRERTRKWREANPDRVRELSRKYRAENAEKIAANNKVYPQAWAKANKGRVREFERARRVREMGARGDGVTSGQWSRILDDSLGLCIYCNERRKLTQDHIDPLFTGGEHSVSNVVAACGSCNSSKGDKSLLVWLAFKANRQQRANTRYNG